MAKKISVQLVDDIDGTDAAETVSFALDGQSYVIDLSEENASALRNAVANFIAHAQKDTRGRTSRSSRNHASRGTTASDIRAWAKENGYDVPDRGRVSAEIKAAYDSAH